MSLLPERLHWGGWWPTSPSTGASLYHAGLPIAWCRLSRVPLTHLGPYLPPSRSLEKTGRGEIFYSIFLWFPLPPNFLSRGITSYLSPWPRQKVTLIHLLRFSGFIWYLFYRCDHSLSPPSVFIYKGRMDKIEVWANSVAACHGRKQQSRYNPSPIHLK